MKECADFAGIVGGLVCFEASRVMLSSDDWTQIMWVGPPNRDSLTPQKAVPCTIRQSRQFTVLLQERRRRLTDNDLRGDNFLSLLPAVEVIEVALDPLGLPLRVLPCRIHPRYVPEADT